MDADFLSHDGRRRWPLWAQMLLGLFLGIAVGLLLRQGGPLALPEDIMPAVVDWVMLPGRLFLALITMVVIPLVFCSILLAIAQSGSASFLRRTGSGVVAYFILTTFVAVLAGVTAHALVKPADAVPREWIMAKMGEQPPSLSDAAEKLTGQKTLPQMIVGVLPVNPAKAVLDREMLQLVVAAALAGLALLAMPQAQAAPVVSVCAGVQAMCMKIVFWALRLAPLAVFSFLFGLAVETGAEMLSAVGRYMATVLAGLAILLAFYMCVVAFAARRHPLRFLSSIRDVILVAFSSSSSSATMPLTLATAEEKLGVKPEVARLVVPLGTIINMDGTAAYQVIVALFLTTLMGIELSFTETAVLCVTIVGAAIGTPGTPGVGIVVLSVILSGLGIPPEAIGVILSVDRLLDMCRTVVNVTGDLVATVLFDRLVPSLSGGNLQDITV